MWFKPQKLAEAKIMLERACKMRILIKCKSILLLIINGNKRKIIVCSLIVEYFAAPDQQLIALMIAFKGD